MSKKIMVAWGIVIFLMCCTLLYLGLREKDFDLMKLKFSIKQATYKYIKDNHKIGINDSSIVEINELFDGKYLSEDKENLAYKYCINNVVYTKELVGYDIKINMNCNDLIERRN